MWNRTKTCRLSGPFSRQNELNISQKTLCLQMDKLKTWYKNECELAKIAIYS
jgi:hypothetical protein